jgi:hypothetical protein
MSTATREELRAAISREEARLAELRSEVDAATARLASLREQLRAAPAATVVAESAAAPYRSASAPVSNAAKVALFRSLFRGREDVFPRRWENAKTGRCGYSPVCSREWHPSLCAKKRVGDRRRATCADCSHQAFVPVSDEEVVRHLRGEQIMGAYPLLPDETCWFLAADFDKKGWRDDVEAFARTCEEYHVPVAVERSRSGNGAHGWFFFSAPVPAHAARKLGCFLLTETMARRHQLSMESYDRLFSSESSSVSSPAPSAVSARAPRSPMAPSTWPWCRASYAVARSPISSPATAR